MRNTFLIIGGVIVAFLIALTFYLKSTAKKIKISFKGINVAVNDLKTTITVKLLAVNPLSINVDIEDVFIQVLDSDGNKVASTKIDVLRLNSGVNNLDIPLDTLDVNEALQIAANNDLSNYVVMFDGKLFATNIKFNYVIV